MTKEIQTIDQMNDVRRVVLSPKSGEVRLEVGALPHLGPGMVLIRTSFSVVSPGTERAKLDLASKGFVGKARAAPRPR